MRCGFLSAPYHSGQSPGPERWHGFPGATQPLVALAESKPGCVWLHRTAPRCLHLRPRPEGPPRISRMCLRLSLQTDVLYLVLWSCGHPSQWLSHEPICPRHGSTFQWGRRLPDFAASSSFGLELDSSSSLGSRAGPGMQAVSSLPSPSSLHDEVADGWGKLDVQSVPRLPEVFGEQGICWGGGTCLYEMV